MSSAFPSPEVEPVERSTRPLYWSVRRELWENRSLTIAPLAVAAIVLFASFISLFGLPHRMRNLPPEPANRHSAVVTPLSMAPAPIMLVTFLVGMFYSLDALYGERRDRSLLFWKSLPVSDRTAVLAKAAIPLAVLPLIGLVLGFFAQLLLLLWSTIILAANHVSPAVLWSEFRVIQEPIVMVYGLAIHALWFAPIYAWLLLISAWARRTPILWATLPLLAVMMVEKITAGTAHFAGLLRYRFLGGMIEGFSGATGHGVIDQLSELSPLRFLSAPGLWIGLLLTAAALAAAIRLRRNREPI
jgi:ABC-2 type transport system permease protein